MLRNSLGRKAGLVLASTVIALFVTAGVAGACTGAVSGVATCDTSTGTYSVTWNVTTSDVTPGLTAKVTPTSSSPSGTALSGLPLTLPQNQGGSFTQTGIPGSAKSAGVSLHFVWTGKNQGSVVNDASGSVPLGGSCKAATPPTTTPTTVPPTPTTTPVTPTTTPSMTLPPAPVGPTLSHGESVSPPVPQAPVASIKPQPVIQTGGSPITNGDRVEFLVIGLVMVFAGSVWLVRRRRRPQTDA